MNLRLMEAKKAKAKSIVDEKLTLKEKKVCFTGKLSRMSRAAAWRELRKKGGVPKENVTKEVDLVVRGKSDWKTTKHQRAIQYGIKMIDESLFYDMVGVSEGSYIQ